MTRLRLATRGSALALAQARLTAQLLRLRHKGLEVETVIIHTTGDRNQAAFAAIAGIGFFVREIEEALLGDRADVAVHSLKDLPTLQPRGLEVVAVLEREDPRDALVTRSGQGLASLPPGAVVATSSPRRRAQLRAARPDLSFVETRGNVDTRLGKLGAGEFDALVLALAGLRRLGRESEVSESLTLEVMLPAPGQGAIALEARAGSEAALLAAALDHPASRDAVEAERAFLLALGGGCSVPVGAHARVTGSTLAIVGLVADPESGRVVRAEESGPPGEARTIGARLAARVCAGGGKVLVDAYRSRRPLGGRRVLVTRPALPEDPLVLGLAQMGAEVVVVPAIAIAPPADPEPLRAAVAALDSYAWVALTSARGVTALLEGVAAAGLDVARTTARFAAVGPATAAALRAGGVQAQVIAAEHHGRGLAAALGERLGPGDRVLLPRAAGAAEDLPAALRALGAAVVEVEAYRNQAPENLGAALARAVDGGGFDAIVFASPSAVRNLVAAAPRGVTSAVFAGAIIATIGPVTAAAAQAIGLAVAVSPTLATPEELAAELAAALGPGANPAG